VCIALCVSQNPGLVVPSAADGDENYDMHWLILGFALLAVFALLAISFVVVRKNRTLVKRLDFVSNEVISLSHTPPFVFSST
jgi:sensor histidine kinase YesM